MFRKLALFLVFTAIVAGGVFALPEIKISVGGGGYFTGDSGGGAEVTYRSETLGLRTPYTAWGGFLFFDATYLEMGVGYFAADGRMVDLKNIIKMAAVRKTKIR
jgi:hypothetical protein